MGIEEKVINTLLRKEGKSGRTEDLINVEERIREEKRMGSERKSAEKEEKRKRVSNSSEDDSKRDKKKKKKHKSHKSSDMKSEEKQKRKHRKHEHHTKVKFQEVTSDDYFAKNNEFSTWLKEEKDLFFSDLSSETARDLFKQFIKDWNKGKLESRYYEGIVSGPRTSHKWKIK